MTDKTSKTLANITRNLALSLRSEIFRFWGNKNLREIRGTAATGDWTFQIDEIAEEHLMDFISKSDFPIAYFSEDKGLVSPKQSAEFLLIVDPVDGTRAAIAGLEGCCVSVAAAPIAAGACLKDVIAATLVEIKTGAILTGVIGETPEYCLPDGKPAGYRLTEKQELNGMLWGFEAAGRPIGMLTPYLGNLIDKSSLDGGCFILNSASFSISRVALGQFDAYIDPWGRIAEKNPDALTSAFLIFKGKVGYLHSYDIAAAIPLAKSAGCIVSDITGNSLDDWRLIGDAKEKTRSCICSSNQRLHEKILGYFKISGL